jgi:sulfide:quinone oxidoreductase
MERAGQVKVLIAGGGVAALEATLALRELAEERVTITLVAPESDFTYRPLAVAEPFRVGDVRRFPLRSLVEASGAELRPARVASVDPNRSLIVTEESAELSYEILLLALGARPREAVPGALTFRGPEDVAALGAILERAAAGELRSLSFAVPVGVTWPLPLYELALLTKNYMVQRGTMKVAITLVTAEESPLAIFGIEATDAMRELLETRGIRLRAQRAPVRFEDGLLRLAPDGEVEADAVVALPRLEGPRLAGIPSDRHGFVPTDDYGRVGSELDIYAAGDLTQFPVKQGGIATQQADTAAASIAARVGADVEVAPFRPVLRGLLLTGMAPRYLRSQLGTAQSIVDTEALWWPPAKIAGRYLAPFLAARLGLPETLPRPGAEAIAVEVRFDPKPEASAPSS